MVGRSKVPEVWQTSYVHASLALFSLLQHGAGRPRWGEGRGGRGGGGRRGGRHAAEAAGVAGPAREQEAVERAGWPDVGGAWRGHLAWHW